MGVYGKNLVNKQIREGTLFPDIKNMLATWVSFNAGDFLILDTTAESECVNFVGMAAVDVVNGQPRSPYSTQVDASVANTSLQGPVYGDTYNLVLQTGSTISAGAAIYASPVAAGTEPNTLVSATGTYQIGIYTGAAGTITSSAAGLSIEVLIGARYPAAASGAQYLKF